MIDSYNKRVDVTLHLIPHKKGQCQSNIQLDHQINVHVFSQIYMFRKAVTSHDVRSNRIGKKNVKEFLILISFSFIHFTFTSHRSCRSTGKLNDWLLININIIGSLHRYFCQNWTWDTYVNAVLSWLTRNIL